MKIAILGAGFTGLTAALRLAQQGHRVTLFEKESQPGGLAVGFKERGWDWSLEKAYHHWFTNDTHALSLARELSYPVLVKRPSTDVYISGKQIPFDSPLSLLRFQHLSFIDRLRTGVAAFYLKTVNNYKQFEGKKAIPWIRNAMGEQSFQVLWDPLLSGKFGQHKNNLALTWFWARVKKRTPSLAYPEGGFQAFAQRMADEIQKLGGEIRLGTEVTSVNKIQNKFSLISNYKLSITQFDKIIVTLPTPIYTKLFPELATIYVKKISSIEYLHALNLVLILDKPLMEKTYWLNITDKTFPFLVVVEHTNFMESKYYAGKHLVYIGNYLPRDHRYFKMTKNELLKEFDPFLRKINPLYHSSLILYHSFVGPFAQPVVTVDYQKKIPDIKTPISNVYLANLSMVYPWDRGTNYAIELGERVAKLANSH